MGGPGSGPQPGYRRPKPDPRVTAADDGKPMPALQKQEVIRIITTGGTYEQACKELSVPMEKLQRNIRADDKFRLSIYDAWYASDAARTVEVEMRLFDKIGTGDTRAMEKWLDNRNKERWSPATKLPGPTLQIGTMNVLSAGQSLEAIEALEATLLKRKELGAGSARTLDTNTSRSDPTESDSEVLDAEVLEDPF